MNYNSILSKIDESREGLTDVIGYFMTFDEENSSDMLIMIKMVFNIKSIFIKIQEDDSFKIYDNINFKKDSNYKKTSLISTKPWLLSKGKPILWSWMLYNQQGYLDGLQFEFAEDVMDESNVIQLVCIAGEIRYRVVSNEYSLFKST